MMAVRKATCGSAISPTGSGSCMPKALTFWNAGSPSDVHQWLGTRCFLTAENRCDRTLEPCQQNDGD